LGRAHRTRRHPAPHVMQSRPLGDRPMSCATYATVNR
jgi:hypothetical protein